MDADISVSPLAVPLLAGPGTIATTIGGWIEILITITVFLSFCIITFFCFIFSSIIGESGLGIVTRLMGLILTVIGVQMLIVGLTSVFTAQ
jgi:multiple antibiotic resistance protein